MIQGLPCVKTDRVKRNKQNQGGHTFLPLPDGDCVLGVQANREEQLASSTKANWADSPGVIAAEHRQSLLVHGVPHMDGRRCGWGTGKCFFLFMATYILESLCLYFTCYIMLIIHSTELYDFMLHLCLYFYLSNFYSSIILLLLCLGRSAKLYHKNFTICGSLEPSLCTRFDSLIVNKTTKVACRPTCKIWN